MNMYYSVYTIIIIIIITFGARIRWIVGVVGRGVAPGVGEIAIGV